MEQVLLPLAEQGWAEQEVTAFATAARAEALGLVESGCLRFVLAEVLPVFVA